MIAVLKRWREWPWWGKGLAGLAALGLVAAGGYVGLEYYSQAQSNSSTYIRRWFRDPTARPTLFTPYTGQTCGDAPFILPTSGFIGLLWNDPAGPYSVLNRHSGIDIFGDGQPGQIPVFAAYDGQLTRLEHWTSAVIIRHDDPLQPGRTIWTYYAHMASQDGESYIADRFPPGATDVPVEQGELLGYQGDYSGGTGRVGLHLHFSIVLSEADGSFRNESDASNTLDPSPYLGLPVNIASQPERPIRCVAQTER